MVWSAGVLPEFRNSTPNPPPSAVRGRVCATETAIQAGSSIDIDCSLTDDEAGNSPDRNRSIERPILNTHVALYSVVSSSSPRQTLAIGSVPFLKRASLIG